MMRRRPIKSDTAFLLIFFVSVIAAGTLLLLLPAAWSGIPSQPKRLSPIDALFTATSAVCVTGLSTVDTAGFTRFGQTILLILIQTGGLGIISFTSLMILIPGRRLSFRRLRTIRSFTTNDVEYDPVRIVRDIVFYTVSIELLGALLLYALFKGNGIPGSAFTALFHAVSAFCNAGFSTFPDSLERFAGQPLVLAVFSLLIMTGGIGFIVLQDIARRIRGKKRKLGYHARLMLTLTAILIAAGAAAFWFLEGDNCFAAMGPVDRAMNALFQSVTPRTAGFDAVCQAELRQSSQLITMLLMFIGGAPGSIAGGIKIATAYVVLLVILRKRNERGEINSLTRRFSPATIDQAVIYLVKALAFLFLAAGALSLTEAGGEAGLNRSLFEVVSAFGTVGLSLGLTPSLSLAGKLVIIVTMFAGRVGLLAFVFLGGTERTSAYVYPEAEILLG